MCDKTIPALLRTERIMDAQIDGFILAGIHLRSAYGVYPMVIARSHPISPLTPEIAPSTVSHYPSGPSGNFPGLHAPNYYFLDKGIDMFKHILPTWAGLYSPSHFPNRIVAQLPQTRQNRSEQYRLLLSSLL